MSDGAQRADFGVIFDNDGVLVDTEGPSMVALHQAAMEGGVELLEEDYPRYCGMSDRNIVRDIAQTHGVTLDADEFGARKREIYAELAGSRGVRAFAGVRELIASLAGAGVPMAIASSGAKSKIAYNLSESGLEGLVGVIVSGEDFSRGKPAPDIVIEAARRLALPPERCAVIEDSVNGLLAARSARAPAVAVTNTFAAPVLEPYADLVVASLTELDAARLRLVVDRHAARYPA